MIVEKDPPEHTRLRKLAKPGFTTRAIESWRSIIENTTDRLLDTVQNHGGMDVVSDLAVPLPGFILPEIMGVPETDRANLLEWAMDIAKYLAQRAAQLLILKNWHARQTRQPYSFLH
jgi:cytochrome P450